MDFAAFKQSLAKAAPPEDLSPALEALWWDAKGDWKRGHGCVDDAPGKVAAWVHAYLHRKEGDLGNASYWYGQAGKAVFKGTLDEEWETIAATLLADQS